jgi:membrane protease YdiL (CAAX protease family)
MMHWKNKVKIVLFISAIIIAYPFFTISYFEIEAPRKMVATYFLAPVLVLFIIVVPRFYFKKMKPLDRYQAKSKMKEKLRDIYSIIMMIFCGAGISLGIFFSIIVTTNSFHSSRIKIREVVLNYEPYTTRHGRLRHYIDIINPRTKNKIHLEVYREYQIGALFEKEMNCGIWGILYSKN